MIQNMANGRLAVASLGLLSACASGSTYGTVGSNTGKRPTTASAGASGSGASTGSVGSTGTSGTGATSSAGGSSGTTGTDCGADWLNAWQEGNGFAPDAGDCAEGLVELKGRLTDICEFSGGSAPPITGSFSAVDGLIPSIVANTALCGVFWYCVPPGTQLTPKFVVSSYVTTELSTLNLTVNGVLKDDESYGGLNLYCSSIFSAQVLGSLSPTFNPALAYVAINVNQTVLDAGCMDKTGWSFVLSAADAGVLVAPSFVLTGTASTQSDAGTSAEGVGFFYNLDPSLGSVTVIGDRPGNQLPDGGLVCPELSTDPSTAHFTGAIPLHGGTLTYFQYIVP